MEIAIANKSKGVTDYRVAKWAAACNRQVQRDFLPVWGGAVNDIWVEYDSRPEHADWIIEIHDTSDYPGAAGYHTFDSSGKPWGRVFLDTGLEPSVILSHEVLEALADPGINRWAINWNDNYQYAMEVCDPVQDTSYNIDDVEVSDFVYPAWFGMQHDNQRTAHSYRNRYMKPFSLADGGYLIRWGSNGEEVLGASKNEAHARTAFRAKQFSDRLV